MKLKICKALALALAFTLVDCASQQMTKQVDAEVKAEPVHTEPNALANKGYSAVEQSSNLTPEQKIKLTALIDKAHDESKRLAAEDSQIKGVLIETMTATPYDPGKVMELKHRLMKNSQARISNTMHSLHEMQKVMGVSKTPAYHDEIYKELLYEHPGQPREIE